MRRLAVLSVLSTAARLVTLFYLFNYSYLRAGQPFIFNATNISRDIRDKWTGLFADYHARIHLHYLEVPYTQLLQQNRNREHPVPETVISHLLDKLDIPEYSEAHDVQHLVDGN
ncbi:AAA family ATPase [Cardiobacterium valvarum]|uniref:Predicted kinase n=1 Tax=Cardiobacterium valvarum TaxID=194702 RepID=A0A381EED7_9GAMM|nr:AAA family ATPase [Cardiobacterium valvarum]SUX25157.1 Predicted kinase [Cardiobacterium valvarum]